MTGWVAALGLASLVMAALFASKRCSRLALELVGAALLAGLAGYAWTGSPDLPGNPVSPAPLPT